MDSSLLWILLTLGVIGIAVVVFSRSGSTEKPDPVESLLAEVDIFIAYGKAPAFKPLPRISVSGSEDGSHTHCPHCTNMRCTK